MLSRKYSPMEPVQRQALEHKRGKRFYKPLFQIRKPGDAVGLIFILAGFAALGWLSGVLIFLLLYLLSFGLATVGRIVGEHWSLFGLFDELFGSFDKLFAAFVACYRSCRNVGAFFPSFFDSYFGLKRSANRGRRRRRV